MLDQDDVVVALAEIAVAHVHDKIDRCIKPVSLPPVHDTKRRQCRAAAADVTGGGEAMD